MVESIESRPVAEGLFQWADGAAALIGSRCSGCGTHYFPKSLSCRRPDCTQKSVQDVLMGRRGELYSFTVQGYRPPPLFKMDDWAPYAIGLVELPEGLRVMGMLTGCALDAIRIGMEVELTVEPLYHDDAGVAVLTYKFKPVDGAGSAS